MLDVKLVDAITHVKRWHFERRQNVLVVRLSTEVDSAFGQILLILINTNIARYAELVATDALAAEIIPNRSGFVHVRQADKFEVRPLGMVTAQNGAQEQVCQQHSAVELCVMCDSYLNVDRGPGWKYIACER